MPAVPQAPVPEGFQFVSEQPFGAGAKNVRAIIKALPGFMLASPIEVIVSENNGCWAVEHHSAKGSYVAELYNENATPEEAAYALASFMASISANYKSNPPVLNIDD